MVTTPFRFVGFANRIGFWLLARRLCQLSVLGLFLLGPLTGIWIIKGNLNASLTLDTLPLTDPFMLLQSLAAGHTVAATALLGGLIVAVVYALLGRVYCSWVCPINVITDTAAWLRHQLGISGSNRLARHSRYWLLAAILLLAGVSGNLVWEWLNPVTMLNRGLVFGMGLAWLIMIGVLLLDVFISPRAWCGHLCPMGAFYSLLGSKAWLRVSAVNRKACNNCGDCYRVCPEPQVIKPALKGTAKNATPIIDFAACSNCARCIDVCSEQVFHLGSRFSAAAATPKEV